LVGHDGGTTSGDYIQSLNFTDIATCWDTTVACKNKAQKHVFEAIKTASARFPFKIAGIDSDNGSEFINALMLAYCIENKITFTRSRAHKKNDSCFVEQKNYSIVRRAVGYLRYDTRYNQVKLLHGKRSEIPIKPKLSGSLLLKMQELSLRDFTLYF